MSYYPNLKSFQATDRKLQQLLNEHPDLYIQMILVPDGSTESNGWTSMNASVREQMWTTIMARWAAFPNVFWTIANDLPDTTPEATALGREASCYFAEHRDPTCSATDYNPWRRNRPLSFGHLRGVEDSMQSESWHNYITAYAWADNSAQQMDGTRSIPPTPGPDPRRELRTWNYAASAKPAFYVEDIYEREYEADGITPNNDAAIAPPYYFYRRLFWSYLLSGSGVTYGAGQTWRARATYLSATPVLTGLTNIQNIPAILADTRADLNLFKPDDARAVVSPATNPPWTADTVEINRAQVAVRDGTEILLYNPNVMVTNDNQAWEEWYRRGSLYGYRELLPIAITMTGFKAGTYSATWYTAQGRKHPSSYDYAGSGVLTVTTPKVYEVPEPYANDVILHLGSRCTGENKCEPMDSPPPAHTMTSTNGIHFYAEAPATLTLDTEQYVIGILQSSHGSWRCDRNVAGNVEDAVPGCILTYVFPEAKPFASVDYKIFRAWVVRTCVLPVFAVR
jgi:hypothetical protein